MCEKKIQQKKVKKLTLDFGGVLAKHSKEGHEKAQVMEHKYTH